MHDKTVFPQWLQQFVIVLQDDGNLIKNVTSVVAKFTTLMYYFIYTYMCMYTYNGAYYYLLPPLSLLHPFSLLPPCPSPPSSSLYPLPPSPPSLSSLLFPPSPPSLSSLPLLPPLSSPPPQGPQTQALAMTSPAPSYHTVCWLHQRATLQLCTKRMRWEWGGGEWEGLVGGLH